MGNMLGGGNSNLALLQKIEEQQLEIVKLTENLNVIKDNIDKITTVNTELITNTGYKVLSHNITTKNGICYVYLYMECLEKKSEWTEMMSNLPRSPQYFEFPLAPISSNEKTASIRLAEGKIAVAYGVAGQRYNTYFSYPIITV